MKPLHADNNKTALLTPIPARPCSWMQLTLDFFRTMMHPQGYTHWNKNIQAVLLYVHTSHRSSFFGDEWDLIKSIQLKAPVQSIIVAKKQISNSIALEINQSITNCGKPRKKMRRCMQRKQGRPSRNQDLSTKNPEKVDNSWGFSVKFPIIGHVFLLW